MAKNDSSVKILSDKVKDGTFSEIIEDWKWIFSYSSRYKKEICIYIFLGVVSATAALAASVAGKYVIDIVSGYQFEKLGLMAVLMIGSAVFSLLFKNLVNRISTVMQLKINQEIQAEIYDRIIDIDWLAISRYENGDILNRFNGDISTVSEQAISFIPSIIIAVYNLFATFFVIWHYDHIMALLTFVTAPLMLVMSRYFIRKQHEYSKKVREASSKMMSFEAESFYNMDTLKSFGVTALFGKRLRENQENYREIALARNAFRIKTNIFMSVIGMIVQYAAFGYCLYLLWTGKIILGTMVLFLEQRTNMSTAFNNVISLIPSVLNGSVSAHRIRELVQLPEEIHIEQSSILDKSITSGISVQASAISFGYEEESEVFSGVSFYAKPGEIIAFVGESGGGKTTVIRLILGLIHPLNGKITLCGKDGIETPCNADTRHYISYVPQGNTIMSGTIAENLRLGKDDASEEDMISALKTACAWEFVFKLKDSLNHNVGERGKGLSEGQAQRIAVARALLRDAPILLLDEATSALDVSTERKLLRNIMIKMPNKTCIVTTHRPSVIDLCERVYQVGDGKVVLLDEEEAARRAVDF